jgi:hypothetical protein
MPKRLWRLGWVALAVESGALVWLGGESGRRRRRLFNDTYVDDHVISEILIACDECVAPLILETDAFRDRRARVQAVEILHGGDNRVCRIMRENLNTQRQACTRSIRK